MTEKTRPVSVTILAWVYIAVGAVGVVSHFSGIHAGNVFHYDGIPIEAVEVLAIAGGAFMLRGQDWARWLAMAWIVFHVILSVRGPFYELAIHCLFCAAIAWVLFRPAAMRYFRR